MKIQYLNDQGIHGREIKGIETLKSRLPSDWYGFASLELLDPGKKAQEVDVAIVMDDRILLADLKDWNGHIESDGARWHQNGNDVEASPIPKIRLNAKVMAGLLRRHVIAHPVSGKLWVPFIGSCVILTSNHRLGAFPTGELEDVMYFRPGSA